jgi:hypothetical protein
MSGPPTKKTKRSFDWKLVLSTPQTFKTLLNTVHPTVENVTFQVCMEEEDDKGGKSFSGIRIDAINSSKVCLIKVAYECDVTASSELRNEWFSIDVALLKKLLKRVQPSNVIEMTMYTDGASVEVKINDREDRNNWSVSTIQLMEDSSQGNDYDIVNMTFNHVIEMDLDRLKQTCDLVDKIGSTEIEFCIEEPEEQPDSEHHNFFTISAQGEGASTRKIHHTKRISDRENPEEICVCVVTNPDNDIDYDAIKLVQKYSGSFPNVYMNGVLKSMERQTIQLYFGEGLPLVMHYGLGNDTSYVKVILALKSD